MNTPERIEQHMAQTDTSEHRPKPKEWQIERMRASGPGGQHLQKTESKVRIRWNFELAENLTEEAKAKLRETFPEGYIEATSQRTRSQRDNLELAHDAIRERAAQVLMPKTKRIPTTVPSGAKERRVEEKRKRGETKRLRRRVVETREE